MGPSMRNHVLQLSLVVLLGAAVAEGAVAAATATRAPGPGAERQRQRWLDRDGGRRW